MKPPAIPALRDTQLIYRREWGYELALARVREQYALGLISLRTLEHLAGVIVRDQGVFAS